MAFVTLNMTLNVFFYKINLLVFYSIFFYTSIRVFLLGRVRYININDLSHFLGVNSGSLGYTMFVFTIRIHFPFVNTKGNK